MLLQWTPAILQTGEGILSEETTKVISSYR
jgi:hypothetical protein